MFTMIRTVVCRRWCWTPRCGDRLHVALIVADGARSPLGRVLGRRVASGDRLRRRDPRRPRDAAGQRALDHVAPGAAVARGRGAARLRLIFPLGNGEVNIGVGTLATAETACRCRR